MCVCAPRKLWLWSMRAYLCAAAGVCIIVITREARAYMRVCVDNTARTPTHASRKQHWCVNMWIRRRRVYNNVYKMRWDSASLYNERRRCISRRAAGERWNLCAFSVTLRQMTSVYRWILWHYSLNVEFLCNIFLIYHDWNNLSSCLNTSNKLLKMCSFRVNIDFKCKFD